MKSKSVISKNFTSQLKEEYQKSEGERRQIISLSNIILHDSKRIIFALHRGDIKSAEEKFREIEPILEKLEKNFGTQRINEEGAYKAAAEEFVEAKIYYLFLMGKSIDRLSDPKLNYETYLGGICDFTGELVRRAINESAKGNYKEAQKINLAINEIMNELIEFDMTGYMRTKYDQAKNNLRKIEQINYEIKLRK